MIFLQVLLHIMKICQAVSTSFALIQDILLNNLYFEETRGGPVSVLCLCISHHSIKNDLKKVVKTWNNCWQKIILAMHLYTSSKLLMNLKSLHHISKLFTAAFLIRPTLDRLPQQTVNDFHFRELNLYRDELILNS